MSKWADYLISAVRYDVNHKHITHIRAHKDNGDSAGVGTQYTRQQIIDSINNGTTFITTYMGENEKWQKGQKVFVIKINGISYLKTVDNKKTEDNLENLPEF